MTQTVSQKLFAPAAQAFYRGLAERSDRNQIAQEQTRLLRSIRNLVGLGCLIAFAVIAMNMAFVSIATRSDENRGGSASAPNPKPEISPPMVAPEKPLSSKTATTKTAASPVVDSSSTSTTPSMIPKPAASPPPLGMKPATILPEEPRPSKQELIENNSKLNSGQQGPTRPPVNPVQNDLPLRPSSSGTNQSSTPSPSVPSKERPQGKTTFTPNRVTVDPPVMLCDPCIQSSNACWPWTQQWGAIRPLFRRCR